MTPNLGSFPSQTPLFRLRIWGNICIGEVTESQEREWGWGKVAFFPGAGLCLCVCLCDCKSCPAPLPIKCFGVHTQSSLALGTSSPLLPRPEEPGPPVSLTPATPLSQDLGQRSCPAVGTRDLFGLRLCSPLTSKAFSGCPLS